MDAFVGTLRDAADKTRRPLRLLELRGQPANHPTLPAFPEGRYLKFVLAASTDSFIVEQMRFLFGLLLLSRVAGAEEVTLRVGTVVPDGTSWAREIKAMARNVETNTAGAVHLKVYMGGIAGDELEMMERVHRGQLDGLLSAGMACETVAPSLRVARVPGVFQTWAETAYVIGRLRPFSRTKRRRTAFATSARPSSARRFFSRKPLPTLCDVRDVRFWIWDIDRMLATVLPAMGVRVEPVPIRDAVVAYERGQVDGFIAPAVAALGFQWSTAARYYTDLRMGFVVGCMVIANRAFDALPMASQQSLRVVAAKIKVRFEEVGRAQEAQLLHGLFEKQGLSPSPSTPVRASRSSKPRKRRASGRRPSWSRAQSHRARARNARRLP